MRRFRVGGFLATGHGLLARLVGDRVHVDPALLGHALGRGQVLQAIERCPHHVVRIGGPQALGQDVAHPGALEHGAHGSARDHARPRGRRLYEHPSRSVVAHDFVGDGAAGERDLGEPPARRLHGLADGLAHLVRLAGGDADVPLSVAHGDQRIEAEPPAALDDLGDAVDGDHVLEDAVAFARRAIVATLPAAAAATTPPAAPAATTAAALAPATAAPTATTAATATGGLHVPLLDRRRSRLGGGRLALRIVHHQNSNPPLRAPSATAFTRPWYW